MKRFLLFLVVAIASISIGLTIYYFSTDNEVILIRSSYLVIEDGDTISTDGLVEFKYRDEHTTLVFSARNNGSESLLTYNEKEGFFTTEKGMGGESKIVVTTNNRNYPELVINVIVCDGSKDYPYEIKNASALSQIGEEGNKYTTDKNYKLVADISYPTSSTWKPISNFSGVFDGNFYTISNINISEGSVFSSMNDVGFISTLEQGGVVKNVNYKNLSIDVTGKHRVGAVVGKNNGTVMTTEVTGSISSLKNEGCYVGGIVGENCGGVNAQGEKIKAKVDRCGFEGNIILKGTDETDVASNSQVCGGVAGHNYAGNISESYFRVIEDKLSIGKAHFGGIVGLNEGYGDYTSNIYDCYCYLANGIDETSSYSNIGGVVYQNSSATNNNLVMGNYYNCGEEENEVSKLSNGNAVVATEDKNTIDGNYNKFLTLSNFGYAVNTVFVSYIRKVQGSEETRARYWDFGSVWSRSKYPILNTHSAMGSTYPIDTSEIKGKDEIASAEELYSTLKNNPTGSFKLINNIDFTSCDWKWGDSDHQLFEFNGILTSDGGVRVIKNLNIINTTVKEEGETVNVGMFTKLGTNSYIMDIKFENVTMSYDDSNAETRNVTNVGVLAGESDGATIVNVEIDGINVDLYGNRFGGIVGLAEERTDKFINNVIVKNVEGRDSYFTYAGGFVGENSTTIDVDRLGEDFSYNKLYNIKLVANCLGGAVGLNKGAVSCVDASLITFIEIDSTRKLFNVGAKFIVVGGIAGQNKGTITSVYANINIETMASANYSIYAGGLIGYNSGALSLGYSRAVQIKIDGSYTVCAGGLVGANAKGTISRSVVDQGTIDCATENHNTSISIVTNVPLVGGLVGFDARTANSYSISGCVSYIESLKGAFAGGLVGNAHGKIESCHSGSQSKVVNITGFVTGGLAGIVPGEIKNCYTICTLSGKYTDNAYDGISSIVNLKVSTVGGFTSVLAYESSKIEGCYAVVTFKDGGVRLSTCADAGSKYKQGEVIGGVYTTEGTPNTNSFGKIISNSELTGTGDNGYQAFYANIGSEDAVKVWNTTGGGYPRLNNVDENLPKEKIVKTEE